MDKDLIDLKIKQVEGVPALAWSTGLTVKLPVDLADILNQSRKNMSASVALSPKILAPLEARQLRTIASELRMRRLYTAAQPVSSRLPISYTKVPGWLRQFIAKGIGRVQRARSEHWAAFPAWPLDLSADFVADLAGHYEGRIPAGTPTPVLLSHDLDTAEGLSKLVRDFLDVEESVGARSANYIVPFGWSIDHVLLDEVFNRGHEIGIHGYDHSNRTPFSGAEERRRRLAAAVPLLERYDIIGYRAPSLLRTEPLLQDLVRHYRYDSSVPTSGGLFPVPNNGCASARPFRLSGLWEIPLTMPRDGSLRFLGHSPAQILALWQQCAETIAASGGIVSVLTHCEAGFSGNPLMLDTYRRFLEHLAGSGRFVFITPRQLLGRLDETLDSMV